MGSWAEVSWPTLDKGKRIKKRGIRTWVAKRGERGKRRSFCGESERNPNREEAITSFLSRIL